MTINRDFQREQVRGARSVDQAFINEGLTQRPQTVQRLILDLSTARTSLNPLVVNYPFKSLKVEVATDTSAYVYCRPNTMEENQDYFKLILNDAWSVDHAIAKSFLHWPAQAGKTMEIILFADSQFSSGTQISVTSGGVSITEGSTITGPTRVTLAATTATIIAPALSTRKTCTIQNKTGADLYIGGASIGAVGGVNEGIKFPNDSIIYWKNTGALYGWSVAGGNIHYNEES